MADKKHALTVPAKSMWDDPDSGLRANFSWADIKARFDQLGETLGVEELRELHGPDDSAPESPTTCSGCEETFEPTRSKVVKGDGTFLTRRVGDEEQVIERGDYLVLQADPEGGDRSLTPKPYCGTCSPIVRRIARDEKDLRLHAQTFEQAQARADFLNQRFEEKRRKREQVAASAFGASIAERQSAHPGHNPPASTKRGERRRPRKSS